MPRIRRGLAAFAAVITMVALPPGASAAAEDPVGAAPRMPLGAADLQTVAGTVQTLAPRVTYQKFSQGKPSDVWSVELVTPTNEQGGRSWVVGNPKYADALVNRLADEGFADRVDTRQVRVLTGGEAVLSESMVRVGAFRYDKQADADRLRGLLETAGHAGGRLV